LNSNIILIDWKVVKDYYKAFIVGSYKYGNVHCMYYYGYHRINSRTKLGEIKMKDKDFQDKIMKELEKLEYPEEIFEGMSEASKEVTRKCWSGNPDKFLENMEKAFGICVEIVDEETGTMEITKRS